MAPVIFPRPGGVKTPVVLINEDFPALRVLENPIPELLLDFFLLLLGYGSFLRVNNTFLLPVFSYLGLVDLDGPEI